MESVSFLSLCKVTTLSIFDRMARNVHRRMIAADEKNSSMDPSPYTPRRRRVAGAYAISSAVAQARPRAKKPVRKPFKPLRDLAIHSDD
jgi:hypothetical protein